MSRSAFATRLASVGLTAAAAAVLTVSAAFASHAPDPTVGRPGTVQNVVGAPDQAAHAAGLRHELAQVRRATAKFHRVDAAVAAGYELGWVDGSGVRILTGCVSDPTAGAMGYHYFNAKLMADNAVNAREPEALVYAPTPTGGLKLVAVEWVVRGPQSNPPGVSEAPSILGMKMHILVPPPGPAFYLMHAWVWKHNPSGMFADWNPNVSCS
ncbi:MAG: hypothetical protein ABI083_15210 [Lapillicoccus sp.]